jgi:hypothetical protein
MYFISGLRRAQFPEPDDASESGYDCSAGDAAGYVEGVSAKGSELAGWVIRARNQWHSCGRNGKYMFQFVDESWLMFRS